MKNKSMLIVIMLCIGLQSNMSFSDNSQVASVQTQPNSSVSGESEVTPEPTMFQKIKDYIAQSRVGRFTHATWRKLREDITGKSAVLTASAAITSFMIGRDITPETFFKAYLYGLPILAASDALGSYGIYTEDAAVAMIKDIFKQTLFKYARTTDEKIVLLTKEDYFIKELMAGNYFASIDEKNRSVASMNADKDEKIAQPANENYFIGELMRGRYKVSMNKRDVEADKALIERAFRELTQEVLQEAQKETNEE